MRFDALYADMKIIHALPRRMRFELKAASSVELCVAEWISGSKYRHDTTVFAERGDQPLLDVDIFRLAPARRLASWHLAHTIRRQVRLHNYDLIVAQQHVATVGRIALFNPRIPVILQTHNFIEPPRTGVGAEIHNALRLRQFQRLAGMTLISDATLRRFESDWPEVTIPRKVVSNGFDFSTWNPQLVRENVVIVVGRTHETKGILEAAQGISVFLQLFPNWRTTFILSEPKHSREYFNSVVEALKPAGHRAEILTGIPFARVKQITEGAGISVVASKWEEPFGRTALEAHAGGAALISSNTGGLREISGDAAAVLDDISGPTIAAQLARLASDHQLRAEISTKGMKRVRSLFSLTQPANDPGISRTVPICERLDQFYEVVLARHIKRAHGGKVGYGRAL